MFSLMGLRKSVPSFRPAVTVRRAMAYVNEAVDPGLPWCRSHLELCWQHDCDIDPLIERARRLRQQHAELHAASLDEEMLPLF